MARLRCRRRSRYQAARIRYLVTIDITPQPPAETASRALDALYGALADTPLPEIIEDRYPEIRDEL